MCMPVLHAMQVCMVCDLPVLQLYLLAGMVRLNAKKHVIYNFEVRGCSQGTQPGVCMPLCAGYVHATSVLDMCWICACRLCACRLCAGWVLPYQSLLVCQVLVPLPPAQFTSSR